MPTNTAQSQAMPFRPPSMATTQKVVIVNGTPETFDLLDVLDAGHYDVVFVESNEHAGVA